MKMEIKKMFRQTGKTTLVIERTKENQFAVMVVLNQREKKRIILLCPEIKERVVTFEEFKDRNYLIGRKWTEAYVDQLDLCLNDLSIIPITFATID